jgi:hypothetical protein
MERDLLLTLVKYLSRSIQPARKIRIRRICHFEYEFPTLKTEDTDQHDDRSRIRPIVNRSADDPSMIDKLSGQSANHHRAATISRPIPITC